MVIILPLLAFVLASLLVVAAAYALMLGIVYRSIRWREMPRILVEATLTTAQITFIVGAAGVFGWAMTYAQVPAALTNTVTAITTDKIVVLMTAEHGKVRAVAKGVRKTRSKFGARLEPMSHVRLLLYRGRELDIVNQAESVEPLGPMLASLDRASQGMAAIEAVDQLAIDREPNPQLYQQAVGVLRTIAQAPAAMNVGAFYWRLLAAEGLEPHLDGCVRCGEAQAWKDRTERERQSSESPRHDASHDR